MGVECALTIIMWKLIREIQYPYELTHLLMHRTFNSRVIFLLESLSAGIVNDFNNLDFCTQSQGCTQLHPPVSHMCNWNITFWITFSHTEPPSSWSHLRKCSTCDWLICAQLQLHTITWLQAADLTAEFESFLVLFPMHTVSSLALEPTETEGNQSMVDCYQGLLSRLEGSFISCWWMLLLDSLPCFSLFGR